MIKMAGYRKSKCSTSCQLRPINVHIDLNARKTLQIIQHITACICATCILILKKAKQCSWEDSIKQFRITKPMKREGRDVKGGK